MQTPAMINSATITKPVKIELENRGVLTLQPKDYVVSGGEGAIYKPSTDTIIKLYHDTQKMRHDGMPQKLSLLSQINHPFIVNPKGLVYEHQAPIGYYMKFEEGENLAKVFTTAYRQRENFTDKDAIMLVDGMRTAVKVAHDHKAVLVDANELNWLVAKNKKTVEPRLIDVDSWKISTWDASVIMLSIRDWHTKGFNEGSDWFSLAVVTFQIFTGIHPYKGGLDGFKTNDIESRMKANKSVFTPGVRLNSAVRDFGCIPVPLLEWYESVFQQGDRTEPPSPKAISNKTPKPAVVKRVVVANNGKGLVITEVIYDGVNDTPIQVFPCGIIRMASGQLVDLLTKKAFTKTVQGNCEVISTPYGYLLAEIAADGNCSFTLLLKDGSAVDLAIMIKAHRFMRYQNRLFVVGTIGLTEVTVRQGAKPMLVTLNTWQILLNSTTWFDGVGLQDALGAVFFVAPFSEKSCVFLRVPELDKKKVVDAKAGTRYIVATTIDNATGLYTRYEFVMDKEYKTYSVTATPVSTPDLNISILPKGVNATIVDDGQLVISVPVNGSVSNVNDSKIESAFILSNWENKVTFTNDKKVFSLALV